MLLEALVKYYDTISDPILPGFRKVRVEWQLDFDKNGNFLNFKALYSGGEKPHQGKIVELPFLDRVNNPPPCLIHDYTRYVFGGSVSPSSNEWSALGLDEQKKLRKDADEHHNNYLQLLDECVTNTNSDKAKVVYKYLTSNAWVNDIFGNQSLEWNFNQRVLILVDGEDPFTDESVKAFWLGKSTSGNSSKRPGICLVCGTQQTDLARFFKKVVGISGTGSKGASLLSFNSQSHEHYGKRTEENLSLCHECANKTQISLQTLRGQESNSKNLIGCTWLWWSTGQTNLSLDDLFFTEDISESSLGKFLASPFTGEKFAEFSTEHFLAVALSSNPGRIAVRKWLDVTIPDAYESLNRWFESQRIIEYGGIGYSKPLSVSSIIESLERPKTKSTGFLKYRPLSIQILESALLGDKIPRELGDAIIRRIRVTPSPSDGERISTKRASVIKMFLLSNIPDAKKGELMELEPDRPNQAYQCGRLLSILNAVQRHAQGPVNASIVDRFYGAASTTPANIFPRLIRGAQPHLSKLDDKLARILDERIAEVVSRITEFPRSLSLKDQAEFALGFYHQRAHEIKAAKEHKQAKSATESAQNMEEEYV